MLDSQSLNQDTSEDQIAELVDAIKKSPDRREELVALLPEQLSLYKGRGTKATIRIRGYILAGFEEVGLPDGAMPYVLEELESGRDAYLVAGAARALRGLAVPMRQIIPFLLTAVENIKYVDDALNFETYRPHWPVENYTTALTEIFRTFAWMGADGKPALSDLKALHDRRDAFSASTKKEINRAIEAIQLAEKAEPSACCVAEKENHGAAEAIQLVEKAEPFACCATDLNLTSTNSAKAQETSGCCSEVVSLNLDTIQKTEPVGCCSNAVNANSMQKIYASVETVPTVADIEIEDQNGQRFQFDGYFGKMPSILTFFYTRCDNPNKCSLTITKLAQLQRMISNEGLTGKLQTAAITYDPGYDLPARLKAYGEARRIIFNDNNRFFRTLNKFDELQSYLRLGVNYNGSIVNRHRIELFILDSKGIISNTFTRLQWDAQEVLSYAKALL